MILLCDNSQVFRNLETSPSNIRTFPNVIDVVDHCLKVIFDWFLLDDLTLFAVFMFF